MKNIPILTIALTLLGLAAAPPILAEPIAESTVQTTYVGGEITGFDPKDSITVVTSPSENPVSYRIHESVTYVDTAGQPVEVSRILPGATVKVEYVEVDGVLFARRIVVPGTETTVTTEEVESVKIQSTQTGLKATKVVKTTTHKGLITEYKPGETLVVRTESSPEPITYTLDKDAVFVSPAGQVIEMKNITPDTPVEVFVKDDDARVVTKVVVQELVARP